MVGQTPNTILGIIPLGSTQVSYPLALPHQVRWAVALIRVFLTE